MNLDTPISMHILHISPDAVSLSLPPLRILIRSQGIVRGVVTPSRSKMSTLTSLTARRQSTCRIFPNGTRGFHSFGKWPTESFKQQDRLLGGWVVSAGKSWNSI